MPVSAKNVRNIIMNNQTLTVSSTWSSTDEKVIIKVQLTNSTYSILFHFQWILLICERVTNTKNSIFHRFSCWRLIMIVLSLLGCHLEFQK